MKETQKDDKHCTTEMHKVLSEQDEQCGHLECGRCELSGKVSQIDNIWPTS